MMNKLHILTTGLRWLWLSGVVLLLDFISKSWVMTHLFLGESISLLPFFSITYAHNPGAAFSFLADAGGWQIILFSAIALMISVFLLVMMYQTSHKKALINCAYALIIGGAIGNLIDRLTHSFVIDFLHFHIKDWNFPIFNCADTAICLGAVIVILDSFSFPRR